MNLSVLHALGIADCAILKRISGNSFILQEYVGQWLHTLFPDVEPLETIVIDESIFFLSDFLIDAKDFWSNEHTGQVKSGIWTEQVGNESLFLEAFASSVNGDKYLIIKNAEQMYYERRETLQIARELTLSNSQVIERHDYLSERLRSILIDNATAENRLPLHEAIKHATIGIMIVDTTLSVQEANPAIFDIFENLSCVSHEQLLSTFKDLVSRQYPEKALFADTRAWQGELLWHFPPLATKWLNVNINPVVCSLGKVSHWIVFVNDQTRIKHLLQSNEELALHDPLTGLPNRQYFWQQLQQCISLEDPFYLISIDIVNFKNTNELYGYTEGDELLKQIAKRISKILGDDDFITRIGADEFMIIRKFNSASLRLYQKTFENETHQFTSTLLSRCQEPYFTQDGRQCDLPIKIGMTQYPQDASKAEVLLNNADLALSHAKIVVDAPIQVYNQALKEASARRLMLEEALKEAITNNELELYLQPIYNISTNKIVKAEALLRWQLGDERIMPDEFIPIAESSNIINAIGRWVISQGCQIIRQLQRNDILLPVSINFSPNQIYDNNLITFIRKNMELTNIDGAYLELEVTESVLISNYQKVSAFLHEIKRLGITIAVDDFGTGYCSLLYLKHLPIDTLKIDRTFVHDVNNNEDDSAIVSAIIALAGQLKLNVIAEGVETKEQKEFLLAHNCKVAQGFYYASPMSVKDFSSLHQSNLIT